MSNLPIYYLSLFRIPTGVAKEIERMQSAFLWGGSDLRRKVHMVRWEVVTKNKKLGGLGLRKMSTFNQCLLLKWWWRFGAENQTLWNEVICQKYDVRDGRWIPKPVGRGSKIWSDIITAVLSNPELHSFYITNSHIVPGDGRRVQFWRDKWVGNVCLMDEFPRLFSLSTDKNGVVKVFFEQRSDDGGWNMGFRRPLLVWEEEEAQRLSNLLRNAPALCNNKPDELKWSADPSELFSVASVYSWSESLLGPVLAVAGSIWNNFAPPKVQFFRWLAWLGKVKTSSFLHRIGILDGSANLACVFCQNEIETVDHILLFCPFVWLLSSNIIRWWGLPGSVNGLLQWWFACRMK